MGGGVVRGGGEGGGMGGGGANCAGSISTGLS